MVAYPRGYTHIYYMHREADIYYYANILTLVLYYHRYVLLFFNHVNETYWLSLECAWQLQVASGTQALLNSPLPSSAHEDHPQSILMDQDGCQTLPSHWITDWKQEEARSGSGGTEGRPFFSRSLPRIRTNFSCIS